MKIIPNLGRLLLVLVIVCSLFAVVTTSAVAAAHVTIAPTEGPIGTSATITATNFSSFAALTVTFGGPVVAVGTTDAAGSAPIHIIVPSVAAGLYAVTATDSAGHSDSCTFTVTAPPGPTPLPTPVSVGTSAIVGGAGTAPTVCAKWETPDDDPQTADTQILPVAGADKMVKFYVVATDPNGLDDLAAVDVTVRYPDGREKFQLRAIKGTASWVEINKTTGLIDMDADGTGDTPWQEAMGTLVNQGRLHFNPPNTLESVRADVLNGKQVILELKGFMSNCQPSASYIVDAMATDKESNTSRVFRNTFFYMSIVALRIDFTIVDWQTVNVDEDNTLYGDNDMSTLARPTVLNIGNDPAYLWIRSTPMTGAAYGKTIDLFDVTLGSTIDPPAFSSSYNSNTDFKINRILVPCSPTQLDLSVHPPFGMPADTYEGVMYLWVTK